MTPAYLLFWFHVRFLSDPCAVFNQIRLKLKKLLITGPPRFPGLDYLQLLRWTGVQGFPTSFLSVRIIPLYLGEFLSNQ